jgi:ABC-2 type transport system ATP-binding protein
MIEVSSLTKMYGRRTAVRDLCFEVGRGEVVGFLGPNGAGKSTTLRVIAGFLGPTSGSVRVAGYDVVEQPLEARRSLGYMPEDCPYYPEMRVREYLQFRAALKGVPAKDRSRAIARACELARISERRESLVGQLSKGYRQRLGLADALVADPGLLILDEPTSGLDPNQIRDVRQVIAELAEQHTVLLSTHILAEVELTCHRALVIHKGQLLAAGSLDELRKQRQTAEAELEVDLSACNSAELPAALNTGIRQRDLVLLDGAPSVTSKRVERWVVSLEGKQLQSVEAWVRAVGELGIGVREARPRRATLEEVFVRLTQEEA